MVYRDWCHWIWRRGIHCSDHVTSTALFYLKLDIVDCYRFSRKDRRVFYVFIVVLKYFLQFLKDGESSIGFCDNSFEEWFLRLDLVVIYPTFRKPIKPMLLNSTWYILWMFDMSCLDLICPVIYCHLGQLFLHCGLCQNVLFFLVQSCPEVKKIKVHHNLFTWVCFHNLHYISVAIAWTKAQWLASAFLQWSLQFGSSLVTSCNFLWGSFSRIKAYFMKVEGEWKDEVLLCNKLWFSLIPLKALHLIEFESWNWSHLLG